MLKYLLDVLRGIVLSPVVTAFARGLVEAVVFLILYSIADFAVALPDLQLFIPMIWTLVRTAEGYVDRIDGSKRRQREALALEAQYAEQLAFEGSPLNAGDVRLNR